MAKMNIVCFGFGQVAKNFIKKINKDKLSFKLTTTSREESKNKKFENINYESFQLTEKNFDNNFITKLISLGAIVNLIAFFIFLKFNYVERARGVLIATFLVAILTIYINNF